MRNEEMARGKKLAMLFFLAVAAAFMLSFARPQAKTYKICWGKKNKPTVYANGKKMKGRTITLKEGGGRKNAECKFTLRNKKGKVLYGWKIKVKNNGVAEYRDGTLIALKAGTTKVTLKRGKKKIAFKVKVKSNGLKVSAKTNFDYNVVDKKLTREFYEKYATYNEFGDGLYYDEDGCFDVYKLPEAQVKDFFCTYGISKLEDYANKGVAKLKTVKDNKGKKIKMGTPFNVITLTIKNNTSHKVTLPGNLSYVMGYPFSLSMRNSKLLEQGGSYRFVTSMGKKVAIQPHSIATVKYVCYDYVLLAAENSNQIAAWGGLYSWFGQPDKNGRFEYVYNPGLYLRLQGVRIAGVGKYEYEISTTYMNRISCFDD